jgi:uncharacterized protein (DUF2336 family)
MLNEFPFLVSLATSERAGDRKIWLRVATDHFVAAGSSGCDGIQEFVEAMTRLLNAADPTTRLEIARKLAPCARTPAELLAMLSAVDSEACDCVLEHAVALSDRELARAVACGGRRAAAVAKRTNLDFPIVEALAAQADPPVLIALAENTKARIESRASTDLIRQARRLAEEGHDLRLANALLQRRPMRPEMAALFLLAKPNERIEILLAAQRLQLGRNAVARTRSPLLDKLEMAAVARRPERFVSCLAEALECERDLAQRIVDDASGEPLAVALAALGAENEVLVRVLISKDLSAGASYQRIRSLARLNNTLNRRAAIAVMAALRSEPIAPKRQRPVSEPGATPGPSRPQARSATRNADLPQRAAGK